MVNKCEIDKEFEGVRCGVDKRIILVWLLPIFTAIVGFWVVFALLYFSTNQNLSVFGLGKTMETISVLAMLMALMAVPAFVWFMLRYRSINYIISKNEVVINEGVINKKRTLIPYNQMQNIHVRRPLLYRLMGLAYIEIETAGISSGFVEGFIPGVRNADKIVKELLTRVERFKKGPEGLVGTYEREILLDILREIRSIKKESPEPERKGEAGESGALRSEIAKILDKEETKVRQISKRGNTCLPVDKAPPDRLGGDVQLMGDVLMELKGLRKKLGN
ncbi:MAG: PH domain-containing protein [Candidatus Micrarchaeota archaeon]